LRYLFRGLIRDTGRPVEGHVEAATEADACSALSQNGVVTEALTPDPRPLNLNDELPKAPEFADALESAFDSSSSQVDFDSITERYRGKKVWVIDRDKIRRRTAQVIDAALALSALHGEGHGKTRERINAALEGMFSDNRNLATERNAESVAGVRFNADSNMVAPPPPPMPQMPASARMTQYLPNGAGGANGNGLTGHPALEQQIGRLSALVKQAEVALAAVSAAARRAGSGGGGPRRGSVTRGGKGEEQNSVLLEIFKSNLALVRGMQESTPATPAEGASAEAVSAEPAAMERIETGAPEAIETGAPVESMPVGGGDHAENHEQNPAAE
jgi:hypothetical protein